MNIIFVFFFGCFLYVDATNHLEVRKEDSKLIERKRQDTRDICRIFYSENERLNKIKNAYSRFSGNNNRNNVRNKREAKLEQTRANVLNIDDAKRVEDIVDQLYDDNDGERVEYRKKTFVTDQENVVNNDKPDEEKSGRRVFFAPASIKAGKGRDPDPSPNPDDNDVLPWTKKWKHGIVPFFIDSKTYDDELAEKITRAFDYIEKQSCIRLQRLREKPVDTKSMKEVEWLYISNPTGIRQCVHSNEKKRNVGVQLVILGYDCLSRGEIVHEIMHVLGFSHEHTRPDRDQYITVLWDNIKPGYKKYFEVRQSDLLMNLAYDHNSVLHYPERAFSKNGQFTIVTEANTKIGQREGLSATDIEKISIVYGHECMERNRQYLISTCPSVVKVQEEKKTEIKKKDIDDYFKNRLWPLGIMNFKINGRTEFSIEERENIKAVMRHIRKETCVTFNDVNEDAIEDKEHGKPNNKTETEIIDGERRRNLKNSRKSGARRHSENVVTFVRSTKPGCQCPPPGRPKKEQTVEINADCFNSVNDLLHLFVHLFGLDHQHNMHDRDNFLHIVWEKLTPEVKNDMKDKLPPAASVGFSYDYQSVMHFPWLQIKDGVTNIMYPIWNDGWAMGHWQGLSATDVSKINTLYETQCQKRLRFHNIRDASLRF